MTYHIRSPNQAPDIAGRIVSIPNISRRWVRLQAIGVKKPCNRKKEQKSGDSRDLAGWSASIGEGCLESIHQPRRLNNVRIGGRRIRRYISIALGKLPIPLLGDHVC